MVYKKLAVVLARLCQNFAKQVLTSRTLGSMIRLGVETPPDFSDKGKKASNGRSTGSQNW
jgi:hypothetical protein